MTEDYNRSDDRDTYPTYEDLLNAPDTHSALHPFLRQLAEQDTTTGASTSRPNLVENREVAYEALFKGELPYEPQPDQLDIGLSGLWRAYTTKEGKKGETVNNHFDQIPLIVESILSDHEKLSRSSDGSGGAAIFAFLNPEYQALVSEITTGAVKNWELALYRNEQPFILTNNENLDEISSERLAHLVGLQSLIIETAAATLEVLPVFVVNPKGPIKSEKAKLSKLISNWGPNFVREWFDGKIITRHFKESGLDDAEVKEWLNTFTPSIRRRFAVNNISDPMEALSDYINGKIQYAGRYFERKS